jgi:cell wall-associated NlpC family hydrolase
MRLDTLNIDALTASAFLWRGTPFHANSCERGPRGGVCCHLLVAELYKAAGLELGDVPLGPPGHARSGAPSIMTPWLDDSPHFLRLPDSAPLRPGDLLGFNLGSTLHHLAILLPNDQIVHAVVSLGVSITPRLDSTWASRHAATWRPITA